MPNIINRERAEALIRDQITPAIMQDVPKQSAFMSMARRLPNMTSNQTRMRVTDVLPLAYFVNGDTGYKQTSDMGWDNVFMTAAELAVIVPIPEAVLNDAEFDIMGEVTPRVTEAMHKKVDAATIFGIDRPAEWDADIITRARQAGNNVAVSNVADMYELILGEGGAFSKVEESGYDVTGAVGGLGLKAKLRGLRTTDGLPIFQATMQQAAQYTLAGIPLEFPKNGAFDNSIAQLIVGDFSQAVYAIRQDITVKILDQAVIQDPSTKEIVYNLAQQDMIALRVVMRLGWALPNPVSQLDPNRTACPFAYIEPGTPVTTKTVTFTVTTGTGNDATAVEGAAVEVEGARLMTNSSGQCVFNLRAGTYDVKVRARGYKTVTDSVTVAGSNVTKAVTLVAN